MGCWCLEAFAKEAVVMVIWWEPLPFPQHPESLQLACAPGAWRAARPSAGSATAGRWDLQSWGPPLGSCEAVKTLEHTLLHLAGKEVGGGELLWVERHPEGLCSPFPPHTRQAATRMPWEERRGWAHMSAVPWACL